MGKYSILFRRSVLKDLAVLPKKDVQRIMEAIRALAVDPRPPQSQKLSGREQYRLRQGAYRILYVIQDDVLIVTVVTVGHRREVYR
ncbi:MAG: type II toxin-antitoxin system RelE/ParE family toxin [Spartobacteria bacterium]|nr:type II toxin-antitoxin system RelE/ParE family toxin [Spartobacteria bacterium]